MRKILIVDDDATQRRLFARRLSLEKFDALTASSGREALARLKSILPDLVIADIDMPDIDGIQMLKIMRSAPQTAMIPMILMTGMPIPDSLLQAAADGLKAGSIHVKGNFRQLIDRIDGILRRPPRASAVAQSDSHLFQKGPVTVDLLHQKIIVGGQAVPPLASKRFNLLVALLRNEGLVDQDVLLADVWGGKCGDSKLVQMTIARLRQDLKDFPALQIRTEGHGYELRLC